MVVGAKIQQIASTNIISLGTTTWLAVCFGLGVFSVRNISRVE
jgi:hypothetical protein